MNNSRQQQDTRGLFRQFMIKRHRMKQFGCRHEENDCSGTRSLQEPLAHLSQPSQEQSHASPQRGTSWTRDRDTMRNKSEPKEGSRDQVSSKADLISTSEVLKRPLRTGEERGWVRPAQCKLKPLTMYFLTSRASRGRGTLQFTF